MTPSSWPYGTSTTAMLTGMEGLAYPPYQPTPGRFSQGVLERLDYPLSWEDWVPTGDAIITSTWTAIPFAPNQVGLMVEDGGHTATSTTVWVSEGNEGAHYWVMNVVTTTGGRTGQRMLEFHIKGHPNHRFAQLCGHGGLTAVAA